MFFIGQIIFAFRFAQHFANEFSVACNLFRGRINPLPIRLNNRCHPVSSLRVLAIKVIQDFFGDSQLDLINQPVS